MRVYRHVSTLGPICGGEFPANNLYVSIPVMSILPIVWLTIQVPKFAAATPSNEEKVFMWPEQFSNYKPKAVPEDSSV